MLESLVAKISIKDHTVGATRHFAFGEPQTNFDELLIVKFGQEDFNIIYVRDGKEITDTGHSSLAAALDHANYEFGIDEKDWIFI
jgi:hypothetical protein